MAISFGMPREEWLFGLLVSSVHGAQHLFLRLFPPLIPILAVDLDATLWQLGLLVSVYLFAGGLFQAPMGVLSDRVDRLYLLIPSFVAMGVGYLVFVLAPTLGPLLPGVELFGHAFAGPFQVMAVGMFVAGVGYAAIHPVGYPLISANISPHNKGKVLGMWGSASKIGDSMAPLLVGVLILFLAWEWVLVGVSVFGFAYAGLLFVALRGDRFETAPPGTQDGEGDGFGGLRENLAGFFVPMSVIMLFFFFVLFTGNGIQTYTPVFVSDVYGYSLSIGGLSIGPESVANFYFSLLLISGAVSQLFVGSLTDAYDHRAVLVSLLGVATGGLLVLSYLALSPPVLALVFVVLGASVFGINPARDALISDITPASHEGRIFGYIWTIALVGSSGYPVVIGYLAGTMGLAASFRVLALGTLFGLVCIGLLFSSRLYPERATAS